MESYCSQTPRSSYWLGEWAGLWTLRVGGSTPHAAWGRDEGLGYTHFSRVGEGSDRIVLLVHPQAAPRGECNQPMNPLWDWAHLVQVRPRKGCTLFKNTQKVHVTYVIWTPGSVQVCGVGQVVAKSPPLSHPGIEATIRLPRKKGPALSSESERGPGSSRVHRKAAPTSWPGHTA